MNHITLNHLGRAAELAVNVDHTGQMLGYSRRKLCMTELTNAQWHVLRVTRLGFDAVIGAVCVLGSKAATGSVDVGSRTTPRMPSL